MQEKYTFQTVPEHEKHRLSRAFVTPIRSNLSPQNGHLILVSGYLVLTGVNLTITWMSNIKDVCCKLARV